MLILGFKVKKKFKVKSIDSYKIQILLKMHITVLTLKKKRHCPAERMILRRYCLILPPGKMLISKIYTMS